MSLFDRFLKPLKKFLKLKKARKTKKRLKKKKFLKKPKASKKLRKNLSRRSGKSSSLRAKKPQSIVKKSSSALKQRLVKEILVGEITNFFSKIQVVVIKMTHGQIQTGNRIHIRGKKTNFYQTVKSLQIESVDVKTVHKGQLAGLKVNQSAKEGDKVYLPV